MAGRNVNKIKPWMLAKNTNEIVSSYVQQMYKQMPISFNKGLGMKTCKVATFRPENRGPLSTWKNQQKELPPNSITPRVAAVKKSSSKMKQHTNNVVNFFKSNKSTNSPTSNLTPSKRLLKTPNYKIYKSLRYGSSCSSSRSSLKRYDERKRQRQRNLAQINYLIRSFHSSKFEPTYARFLMPARNQQLEKNLGSIPDAIKFSNNMIKDLMAVDRCTKNKAVEPARNTINMKPSKRHSLDKWNHPPSLSKYKIKTPKEGTIKSTKSIIERNKSAALLSTQNRDYARLNVGRISQLRHTKPSNELFTPQHDRLKTELHEKHRRNRMKKLGLIKSPTASERLIEVKGKVLNTSLPTNEQPNEDAKLQNCQMFVNNKKVLRLGNQTESKTLPPLLIENNNVLELQPFYSPKAKNEPSNRTAETKARTDVHTKNSCIPLATKSNATEATSPINYTTISPIVALRAQMPKKSDLGSYRYNRHDFFSAKKY